MQLSPKHGQPLRYGKQNLLNSSSIATRDTDAAYSLAGALDRLVVGLTGVGGGALMTAVLLIFFRVSPATAIATIYGLQQSPNLLVRHCITRTVM